MHRSILAILASLTAVTQGLNLFDDGARGPLLGSTFGLPGTNATYDYVIVGGGTAGLAIATRLSATPGISVAVVEAGSFYEIDNGNLSSIPGSATFYTGSDPTNFQPLVDWGINTVPQKVCPYSANKRHSKLIMQRVLPIGSCIMLEARLLVARLRVTTCFISG